MIWSFGLFQGDSEILGAVFFAGQTILQNSKEAIEAPETGVGKILS